MFLDIRRPVCLDDVSLGERHGARETARFIIGPDVAGAVPRNGVEPWCRGAPCQTVGDTCDQRPGERDCLSSQACTLNPQGAVKTCTLNPKKPHGAPRVERHGETRDESHGETRGDSGRQGETGGDSGRQGETGGDSGCLTPRETRKDTWRETVCLTLHPKA